MMTGSEMLGLVADTLSISRWVARFQKSSSPSREEQKQVISRQVLNLLMNPGNFGVKTDHLCQTLHAERELLDEALCDMDLQGLIHRNSRSSDCWYYGPSSRSM